MPLRFPHVRLALNNRLITSGDCLQAFAETARECGLVCLEDLSLVKSAIDAGQCSALAMAQKVLQDTAPESHWQELWQQLLNRVDNYKARLGKPHCPGISQDATTIDCRGIAPVVMDYLLQLLDGLPHK